MNTKLVTSVELSQTLEKLGVKQESEFTWRRWKENTDWVLTSERFRGDSPFESVASDTTAVGEWGKKINHCSAFLSGELGEMLPDRFETLRGVNWFVKWKNYKTQGLTEAEARGRMLVYLIENKLIEL